MAETIYRPPTFDQSSQYYKRLLAVVSSSLVESMVQCVVLILTWSTRDRIHLLANFFLPFQISHRIYFKEKIKDIIKKLKIK